MDKHGLWKHKTLVGTIKIRDGLKNTSIIDLMVAKRRCVDYSLYLRLNDIKDRPYRRGKNRCLLCGYKHKGI